jgi:hypothetical protein
MPCLATTTSRTTSPPTSRARALPMIAHTREDHERDDVARVLGSVQHARGAIIGTRGRNLR